MSWPENTLPKNTRHTRIDSVSHGDRANMAYTVTMLASPSLMPGMGMGGGICASTIKMIRAMVVSIARRVSFFTFMPSPYPVAPSTPPEADSSWTTSLWGRQAMGTTLLEIQPCRTQTWSGQSASATRMRPRSTSMRL